MPCFSTIQRTKMTDAARLDEALRALGYTVSARGGDVFDAHKGVEAFRFSKDRGSFVTFNTNLSALQEIQRKYAEISVRAFAKRAGYSITKNENEGTTQRLTLVNRRG